MPWKLADIGELILREEFSGPQRGRAVHRREWLKQQDDKSPMHSAGGDRACARPPPRFIAVYDSEFAVQLDDRSPLTAADLASHRCIAADLRALTPDIPLLSESRGPRHRRHARQ